MTFGIDAELAALMPGPMVPDISDLARSRELLAASAAARPVGPIPDGVVKATTDVASRDAGRSIRCIIHRRAAPTARRVVAVVVHGGGFVMGYAERDESLPRVLADELGLTVVTLDYRLAPEDPFPAAVDDVEDVLRWIGSGGLGDAAEDGVILSGSSAGGCIAAGALTRLLARGDAVTAVVLDNPVLDDRAATGSAGFIGTPLWDATASALSWRHYLRALPDDRVPSDAAPARSEDLSAWPPTFVTVMALDALRDEGIVFAQRLTDAGVLTELHLYPGTFHGSTGAFPDAELSQRHRHDVVDAFARFAQVGNRHHTSLPE